MKLLSLRSHGLNIAVKRLLSKSSICMANKIDTAIVVEERGSSGIITLNKPNSLNALDLNMIRQMLSSIKQWEIENKSLVIVKSSSSAFCAGGDVKMLIKKPKTYGEEFFHTEYQLNHLIGTCKIPYIALINGTVMGSGLGISAHGQYRIASEKTVFAIPETAIGMFPDVGNSHFLSRLPGKLGMYLALTGARLKGLDVMKCGIATHYCETEQIPKLEQSLLTCKSPGDVENALLPFCRIDNNAEFIWQKYLEQINHCFADDTVEGIFKKLENDKSKWAQRTLETLNKMSPFCLKITHRQIAMGGALSLRQCLENDFRIILKQLASDDFAEGVRSTLIDKDNKPKWNPSTLQDVTESKLNDFFSKIPIKRELILDKNREQ